TITVQIKWVAFLNNQAFPIFHIGFTECRFFTTFRGNGHTGCNRIEFSSLESRNQVIVIRQLPFYCIDAKFFKDSLGRINGRPCLFTFIIFITLRLFIRDSNLLLSPSFESPFPSPPALLLSDPQAASKISENTNTEVNNNFFILKMTSLTLNILPFVM